MQFVTTPGTKNIPFFFFYTSYIVSNVMVAQSRSLTSLDILSPSYQASCQSPEVIFVDHVCGKG